VLNELNIYLDNIWSNCCPQSKLTTYYYLLLWQAIVRLTSLWIYIFSYSNTL